MADDDSFRSRQDYPRGVPGDIRVPRDDATVATAATVASQGSADRLFLEGTSHFVGDRAR